MRAANLICLLAHLLPDAHAGVNNKVQGGFFWGEWSDWEPCVKIGKNHRRRRICFGPIINKKVDKKNCENQLGGTNVDVERCTSTATMTALGRMENPIKSSQWQEWQDWSKCSGNPPVKKTYTILRYFGQASSSIQSTLQDKSECGPSSTQFWPL